MKINKYLLFSTIFIIMTTYLVFYTYSNYIHHEEKRKAEVMMDYYLKDLANLVYKNKQLVLTSAILLSKNNEIKNCIKRENENSCIDYLQNSKESLLNTTFFDEIKIHLHKKDLKSFFRLWDLKNKKNDFLGSFRHSLNIVKNTKASISCIEIGRFSMLIRGISPIIENKQYLGSIETITNFDSIINNFKAKNIDLFILMDKKYEKIVTGINFKEKQKLKNYILINERTKDSKFLENLELKDTSYIKKKNFYLLYSPILDVNQEKIGFYMLKINSNKKHDYIF